MSLHPHCAEDRDEPLVETIKNPLLSRLLNNDIQSLASDTLIFNATMAQEPSVGQVYCEVYQRSESPLEMRLASRDLLTVP